MKVEYQFNFGDKVKDKITDFEGVVTGVSSYITGCNQILVAPKVKADGDKRNAEWWDEGRLQLVKDSEEIDKSEVQSDNGNGADISAPVK